MDRKRKELMQGLYRAPLPERKEEFLRSPAMRGYHADQGARTGIILWQQLHYLPKWCLAAAFFTPALLLMLRRYYPENLLSLSMAMIPFIAWMSIWGSMRSLWYGMEELEMAARFSLKSITLARMEWMGVLSLLWGLIVSAMQQNAFLVTMVHLFTPYLLTTYGCLLMAGRVQSRERQYLTTGITAVFSVFLLYSAEGMRWIYAGKYIIYWLFFLMAAACLTVRQYRRTISSASMLS